MPGERIPLLARVAGGRVLGPRPGMAIVSFWQGIVEIVLRAVALVSGVLCILLHALLSLPVPFSSVYYQNINAQVPVLVQNMTLDVISMPAC